MSKSVIIVDDSIFAMRTLTDFFTEVMEFEVVATGENGTEAVELYEKYKPDLLVLDLIMPVMDGIEALEAIKKCHPDASVIVVTAMRDSEELQKSIELGASGYIEKPLRFNKPEYKELFKKRINDALK